MNTGFYRKKVSTGYGIAMLEVLIALVVVSLGVLGMAGMQLNTIRVASGSQNRSQAVLYAETIIASMRSHPSAVNGMLYDGLDSLTVNCDARPALYCSAYSGSSDPTPLCTTEASIVENEFFSAACGHWTGTAAENGITENLPNGAITIRCDEAVCTPTSSYTVSVTWSETEVINDVDTVQAKQVTMRLLP